MGWPCHRVGREVASRSAGYEAPYQHQAGPSIWQIPIENHQIRCPQQGRWAGQRTAYVCFSRVKAGRKVLARAAAVDKVVPEPSEIVPRIARLMALAIRIDRLIRDGVVENYAELARLGGVSRTRITQIMNLLNLPAVAQEALLFSEPKNASTLARFVRASDQSAH